MKLLVAAALGDLAVLDDEDQVRALDRRGGGR